MNWFWLFVSIALFYLLTEVSWKIFLYTFKTVDDYVQERHMQRLYRLRTDELHKMFSESEEMAA